MIRSRSAASTPAAYNALLDASAAKSEGSSFFEICLASMPVRLLIHSSLVSTIFERSSLVTIVSGTQVPIPAILTVISTSVSILILYSLSFKIYTYNTLVFKLCQSLILHLLLLPSKKQKRRLKIIFDLETSFIRTY